MEVGHRAITPKLCLEAGIAALVLFNIAIARPAAAEDQEVRLFPAAGDPLIIAAPNIDDFKGGYWTSVAFTPDGNSVIGTVFRNPESTVAFLAGYRVGEVHSFRLDDHEPKHQLLASKGNARFTILTTPSGVCRTPLLFARWPYHQSDEVTVVEYDLEKSEQTTSWSVPILRAEKMTRYTNHSICAAAPDDKLVVVGTAIMEDHTDKNPLSWQGDVVAWDLQNQKCRFIDEWNSNQVLAIACSHDGKRIAAGGGHSRNNWRGAEVYGGKLRVWSDQFEEAPLKVSLPKHQIHALAFSPDGSKIASGGIDGNINWIDLENGEIAKSISISSMAHRGSQIETLAYSPDGRWLAIGAGVWNRGGKWGGVYVIDTTDYQVYKMPLSEESHVVATVAFSKDGKSLAAAGVSGVFKVWRLNVEHAGDAAH